MRERFRRWAIPAANGHELYPDLLDGACDCVDRIVLRAYIRFIQQPGGLRVWWRRWQGSDEQLDNAHLMRVAGHFARRLKAWAKAADVPVIFSGAGQRKELLSDAHLQTDPDFTGVFLVVVGRAPASVWQVQQTADGRAPAVARRRRRRPGPRRRYAARASSPCRPARGPLHPRQPGCRGSTAHGLGCPAPPADARSRGAARAYEPASLSGGESADVLHFLMLIDAPDSCTIHAVHAAAEWFDQNASHGFTYDLPPGLQPSAGAGPLWARFYEIGTGRPIFGNRDGVVLYDWRELDEERRLGYAWYRGNARDVLIVYRDWARAHPRP
jgi:hypothetical protein